MDTTDLHKELEYCIDTMKMSILMTPEKANFAGNIHGGVILKHLDEIAYACASRYCGHYVVTLSVDKVLFKHPIHVGELVTFLASVNYTGTTSMEIGIKVIAEDVIKKTVKHTNTCYFTMVALGDDGKPVSIPQLNPTDPVHIKRNEEAKIRRELRMKNKI
ncbi:acyl-CoA thioesterase [Arcobacter sp. 15-2]|uniref:acyl-CoA thioesterase n=1 Tax=Arcobacter sp. 15-2 TaxID=3374109 RepID=UPI00399C4FBF